MANALGQCDAVIINRRKNKFLLKKKKIKEVTVGYELYELYTQYSEHMKFIMYISIDAQRVKVHYRI